MREHTLVFTVALGGFLIFVGIIIFGVVAMVFLGFVDVNTLKDQEYRTLSLWVLFVIGALDLASGIILRRK